MDDVGISTENDMPEREEATLIGLWFGEVIIFELSGHIEGKGTKWGKERWG